MIMGITFLVQKDSSNRIVIGSSYVLGGVLGAGVTMALFWILMTPLRTLIPAPGPVSLAATGIAVCLLIDLRILPHPPKRGQVPPHWRQRFGEARGFFAYGFVLGAGVLTFAPYASTYAIYLFGSLVPSIPFALLVAVGFGLGRTAPAVPLSARESWVASLPDILGKAYRTFPAISALLSALMLVGLVL